MAAGAHDLLHEAVGPAAVRLGLAKLKPVLLPRLPPSLTWPDVEPALQMIDSVDKLRAAAQAPYHYFTDGSVHDGAKTQSWYNSKLGLPADCPGAQKKNSTTNSTTKSTNRSIHLPTLRAFGLPSQLGATTERVRQLRMGTYQIGTRAK